MRTKSRHGEPLWNPMAKTAGTMWDVRDVFYHWTAPAGPGFEFGFEDGVEVPEGDPLIAAAGLVDC